MGRWQDGLWGIVRGLEAGIGLALDQWRRWRSNRQPASEPDDVLRAVLLRHATRRAQTVLDSRLRIACQRTRQQCLYRSQQQLLELDRLTNRAGRYRCVRLPR